VGTTVIYVTHDQSEALTMSDLVVVMHQARVSQAGTPRALYEAPANLFVADFLGDSNLISAQVRAVADGYATVQTADGAAIRVGCSETAMAPGDKVVVLIRPEDMAVAATPPGDGASALAGTIRDISYHGDTFRLDV